MIVGFLFLSAFVQLYWLFRLMKKSDEYESRIKALEARKLEPEKRKPELFGKTEQVQERQPEQPKAGTVAAKAIQPVVYLSQVSHKTIVLDNGGLEWEGKI